MAAKEPIPIGKRFGKLTIIKDAGVSKNFHRVVFCECECGRHYHAYFHRLVNKTTKHCGCVNLRPVKIYGKIIQRAKLAEICGCTLNALNLRIFHGWTTKEILAGKRTKHGK